MTEENLIKKCASGNALAQKTFYEKFAGKKVAIGHPTKDASYSDRFRRIVKSSKQPLAADLVAVTPADTTDDLSATNLRNAVQDKDLESLAKFIPSNIVEDYLKILIGDWDETHKKFIKRND